MRNPTVTRCEVAGVDLVPLQPFPDDRGTFVEFFREEWGVGPAPVQWNVVRSQANVLRGVHVHHAHHDFLTVATGTLLLGLYDLRPDSPTHGVSCFVTLSGDDPHAAAIPPGVCHGFYYPEPTVHIYGVTEYWSPDDELGCRYDAPELGLDWPTASPTLSAKDRDAVTFEQMRAQFLGATRS
jgi:dTDP-4-dehydrorhamnose 3,5-epimerase